MKLFDTIILGVLQGFTEFLPISSSGHLVIVQSFLGLKQVPLLFNLILHLGTVLAVVIVYYQIIANIFRDIFILIFLRNVDHDLTIKHGNLKLFFYILLSTLITGFFGYIFRDRIELFFYRPDFTPYFLFITASILFITKFISKGEKEIEQLKFGYPILIGIVQALAMLPGISRSGATISAGLYTGASRKFSGIYSFLLAIPSILGASIFEVLNIQEGANISINFITMATGFLVSFLTGYAALRVLIRFLVKGQLYLFSFYCFAAGVFMLILLRLR
jgi:undecaprenyl-diphosphatase